MKNIKMKKIGQFRNVVYDINRSSTFVGLDENEEPIYDNTLEKPIIKFVGTIKCHGTNGSVYLHRDEIFAQKKSGIVTIEKDNYGFAFFVKSVEDHFKVILKEIAKRANVDTDKNYVTLYGEWAGKGIQKGVAISNIDKSFFIFGCKITPENDEDASYWLDKDIFKDIDLTDKNIYNLYKFKTYEIDINFESPLTLGRAQKTIEELTLQVEKECPVAKELGFSGIGEGIVFTAFYNDSLIQFKAKGDKHSSSKVTRVASIDIEKLESIEEFVKYACTTNRFEQALGEVFGEKEIPTIKKMGDLIRWLVNDINKEEIDTLVENNLTPKDVNKFISKNVRDRFMKHLDKINFG